MRRSAAACGSVRMPMGVLATVTAVVSMMLLPTAGQAQTAATDSWSAPRTSWGDPDLQGIWDYSTLTPLQRPRELAGKEFFAEEEAAEFRRRRVALFEPSWSFFPVDLELTEDKRTSLIVDPPDGRIPPLTPQGQERLDAMRAANQRPPHGPDDRTLFERCLVGRASGPPMLPSRFNYDDTVQLFQTPGYVVLLNEMIHEVRIVPLDGRLPLPRTIHQWRGDSRGHWDGDTLVVETTSFSDQTNFGGTGFGQPLRTPLLGANMHLIERFTRVGASYAEGVLASGNIVFDVDREVDDLFVGSIEVALREELGFEIPTIVCSGEKLRAVQWALPFTEAQLAASAGTPCVSFLKAEPSPDEALAIRDLSTDADRLVIHAGEIYWLPVSGALNSQPPCANDL